MVSEKLSYKNIPGKTNSTKIEKGLSRFFTGNLQNNSALKKMIRKEDKIEEDHEIVFFLTLAVFLFLYLKCYEVS